MMDLTPLDVRKKRGDFRRILRGYDPQEVDTFLELVEERLEELVTENQILADRVARLEETVRTLEERERAVQEALVTAQRVREEMTEQSRREAELLLREARWQAEELRRQVELEVDRRLLEGEARLRERREALEELERARMRFLKAFRSLLERELAAVEAEEGRSPLADQTLEVELRGWRPGDGDLPSPAESPGAAGYDEGDRP